MSHKSNAEPELIALAEFCELYEMPDLTASIEAGHWGPKNGLVERNGERFMDLPVFLERYRIPPSARRQEEFIDELIEALEQAETIGRRR
jgi:hypothetical protein